MRRWCSQGVHSYLGIFRLMPERTTVDPEQEISRGRSSCQHGTQVRTKRSIERYVDGRCIALDVRISVAGRGKAG